MRQSIQINWKELLVPLHNDINAMWLTFKQELQDSVLHFVPMMYNTWKEKGWTRPLNSKLREHISKNTDSGLDIWTLVIIMYLKI